MSLRMGIRKIFLAVLAISIAMFPALLPKTVSAQNPPNGSITEICGFPSSSDPLVTIVPTRPYADSGPINLPTTVSITFLNSINTRDIISVNGGLYKDQAGSGDLTLVDTKSFSEPAGLRLGWTTTFRDGASDTLVNKSYVIRSEITLAGGGFGGGNTKVVRCSSSFKIPSLADQAREEAERERACNPGTASLVTNSEDTKTLINGVDPRDTISPKQNPGGLDCKPIIDMGTSGVTMRFSLHTAVITGGSGSSVNLFFWYGSNIYKNLWVILDIDGDYEIVIADAPSNIRGDVVSGSLAGSRIERVSGFSSSVYSRVFNECKTNCTDGEFTKITEKNCPATLPENVESCSRNQTKYNPTSSPAPVYALATSASRYTKNKAGQPVNNSAWIDAWGVGFSDTLSDDTVNDSCTLNWIINGGDTNIGSFIFGFSGGGSNNPPQVLERLNIDGKKLNPFSRLSVCLYLWTVYPITEWASGLIEDVGGIAGICPKVKWYA